MTPRFGFTSTATARRRSRAHDHRRRRGAATAAAPAARCGHRRLSGPDQQCADWRFDPCRQRLLSGACAVDLQQEGSHAECAFLTQHARVRWRHRLDEGREKLVDRARAPLGAEVFALERWRVGGSAKILAVTSGTLLRICGLPGLRLRGSKDAAACGLRLLTADRAMVKPIKMAATIRRGAAKRFMFGLLLVC